MSQVLINRGFGAEFEKQQLNYEAGQEIRDYFNQCEKIALFAFRLLRRNPTIMEYYKYLEHEEKQTNKAKIAKLRSFGLK